MQLSLPQVDSDIFTHSSSQQRLVAEISDLRGIDVFSPLYDDACDAGFALRNPRTGNITRWALLQEVRDGTPDNEIQVWIFAPAPETVRKQPELKGYELHLLND